jgi:hypothetical protein
MAVRDAVVDDGLASVLSPCRGARACPLLATRGDWCHGDVHWPSRPEAYRAVERAARLPKDTLASTHLLLGRTGVAPPRGGVRVVGGVMRDTHGVERRYVCADDLVTITGRPRLAPALARAARGDVVDVDARALTSTTPAPRARPARSDDGAPAPPRPPRRSPTRRR